ncbi:hypothetical protein KI387_029648, partial [Taxus chinensis]
RAPYCHGSRFRSPARFLRCRPPKQSFGERVSGEDFFFAGLGNAGDTNNQVRSNVTPANVNQIGGLNTLGISFARIDFAVGGINPPHTHPRATEVLFVFPKALVHFQQNVGQENAVVIAGLSSQLPGVQTIANSLFAADPPLPDSVLSKAFRITEKIVQYIKAQFKY